MAVVFTVQTTREPKSEKGRIPSKRLQLPSKVSKIFSRVPLFMVTALPDVYLRMTELHHESRSMTPAATMEESSGNVQYGEDEQKAKKTKKNRCQKNIEIHSSM
ncbi:hypothetical protein CHARACLAT_020748 [Characodon lateralis]|uniref:Uncharacterized protein n=1 Tax=Characodon lateralis TaxID=208331 RepID=A0ABU7E258_9TELE|nr:hypothetical protein [Characodon lateralis]